MLLKLLTASFIALAVAKSVPDGFKPGAEVPVSLVSTEKADHLFSEFKSHNEIPFEFLTDGCYARATAMAQIAEEQKIEMGRIIATGKLVVETNDPDFDRVEWQYHVATVLYVKGEKDDEPALMVFDPSLFDKPVPVPVWTARMIRSPNSRLDRIYYSSKYQHAPLEFSKVRKSGWDPQDLDASKQANNMFGNALKLIKRKHDSPQSPQRRGSVQ
ncbi:MAG: hypothetical protein IPJ84_06690 [Bdellovibrionales bacterium]|nr:hypothetical protein [Bdellovibrionales bacterium]